MFKNYFVIIILTSALNKYETKYLM